MHTETEPDHPAAVLPSGPMTASPPPALGLLRRMASGHLAVALGASAAVLLASLCINLLSLAVPMVVLHVYDRVLPNGTGQTLAIMLATLALVIVLDTVLRAARAAILIAIGSKQAHLARVAVVKDALSVPPAALRRLPPGALPEAIAGTAVLKEAAAQRLQAVVDLPFGALFLGLVAIIGGWLVLIPLGCAALFAVTAWVLGRRLAAHDAVRLGAERERDQFLYAVFPAAALVKALCAELPLLARLRRLQEEHATALRGTMTMSAALRETVTVFGQTQVAVMVGTGAYMVLEGRLSAGGLAACTLLAGRALQPMQSGLGILHSWRERREARQALRRLRSLATEVIHPGFAHAAWSAAPDIRISSLALERPDGGMFFEDLSLHVPAGQVALIRAGRDTGKSSLLAAVLGMADRAAGEVSLGGVQLGPATAPAIRRQSALLERQGQVFDGTLMQNLTDFGDAERQAEAQYLSFLLGLDAQVKRMPEGYDTVVDGAGRALPVGVRQHVALIRALSSRPRVLLFDEADTGLDAASQLRLANLMRRMKGRVTMLIVSESEAIGRLADRIYTLSDGRLQALSPAGAA